MSTVNKELSNLNEDAKMTLRQKRTKEVLDKMYNVIEEDKWNGLADRVHGLALDLIDGVESVVESASQEGDEVRLGRAGRALESATKALDAVNNWRNKRYMEMSDLLRTESALEAKQPLNTTTNIIFQWQGDGKKSISPVIDILGEVVPEPEAKQLAPKPSVPKENPLEVDGKSFKETSIGKRSKKLCYILWVSILEYPLFSYQKEWLRLPQYRTNNDGKRVATTSCLIKSRRIGGTYATSLKIIMGACGFNTADNTDCKPMDYYFASATHRQAKEVIEECADIAAQLAKHDARFEHKASKLSINFIHPKTSIVAIPASPRSIRGSTGGLVLDEICFMQDFPAIWKAAKAVAFTTPKKPEGFPVFLISTPWAVGTLQHEIMMGIGDSYKNFQRMQVDYERALAEGFPGVSVEEVRSDFGDDAYMVEFMLEWLAIGITYFPLPLLEKSKIDIIPDELIEEKFIQGKTYLESDISGKPRKFGIDLGLTHDLTVITEIAELEDVDIVVNQSVLRGVGAHELGDKLINYMEACDGIISKIRVDRGTIGRAAYDKIEQHFGNELVEPFDGHIKRQISHCKSLKSKLETGRLKMSSQFVDRFSGRKNSSTTTFVELNKIGLELTTGGNVTVKTPRDLTGHCDRAWSLLIAVGRHQSYDGVIISPEEAVIPGYSVFDSGSLLAPQQEDNFLQSLGIFGMFPIPQRRC